MSLPVIQPPTKDTYAGLSIGALVPASFPDALAMAKVLFESRLFPDVASASQACAKIMAGAELGLPPIASLNAFHIVKGKIMTHYSAILAGVKRAGCSYKVHQHTNELCEMEFFDRSGESLGVSSFSIEDARRVGTQNMEKYPKTMLLARAASQGARWFVPEAFNGLIVYERSERAEIEADAELTAIAEDDKPGTSDYLVSKIAEETSEEFDPFASSGDPEVPEIVDADPNPEMKDDAYGASDAEDYLNDIEATPSQKRSVMANPDWVSIVFLAKADGITSPKVVVQRATA